jgi:hypothetical protein
MTLEMTLDGDLSVECLSTRDVHLVPSHATTASNVTPVQANRSKVVSPAVQTTNGTGSIGIQRAVEPD